MAAALGDLLLLLAALVLMAVSAEKAPRSETCKRSQPAPKLNECMRDSLQRLIPDMVKGLPQYGLHPIDPLRIVSVDIPNKQKARVSVDLTFRNLDIVGLKNSNVKSFDLDVNNRKLSTKIDIDGPLLLLGDYQIKGKVLVLPIEGTGKCNITLVNPKLELTEMQADPFKKNGKEYGHLNTFKFKVNDVDRVYYDLQNLFGGRKELGDNMNLVLNDNWKDIFEDIIGPVEQSLGLAFKAIAEHVLKRVPYNRIFP